MKWLVLLLPLLFLSACSTGVVPAGPQTYMVNAMGGPGLGAGTREKAKALSEADRFCSSRGLVMVPVKVTTRPAHPFGRYASAEVTFKALRPGDPEISKVKTEEVVDDD